MRKLVFAALLLALALLLTAITTPPGGVLNLDTFTDAEQIALAVAPDGTVVAAWTEAQALYVKRWNGHTWDLLGAGALSQRTVKEIALGVQPDGRVVAAWLEDLRGYGRSVPQVARWDGARWTALGGALQSEDYDADALSLVLTDESLIVSWRTLNYADSTTWVTARRWTFDGALWRPLGETTLLIASYKPLDSIERPLLVRWGAGAALGFIERHAEGPRLLLLGWQPGDTDWATLRAPTGLDNDFTALQLAGTADGTLLLGVQGLNGIAPLWQYAPGWGVWLSVPLPRDFLGWGSYRLAAAPGLVALLWEQGGLLAAARWDGSAWQTLSESLNAAPLLGDFGAPPQPALALTFGSSGQLFAAWCARPAPEWAAWAQTRRFS